MLDIRPLFRTLPPVTLPVVLTGFEPSAAKLATTLALPYVAARPVSCDPLPMKKLPDTLPVALTWPAVSKLPPVTLAAEVIVDVADINPPVSKLPPVTFAALVIVPVAVINPAVVMLPPATLAALVIDDVAEISPPVRMLPPVMFPVAVIKPAVLILPPIMLPTALTPMLLFHCCVL